MKKFIKSILRRFLGMYLYEMALGIWHLGYVPYIKNPRTFNEKILNRKIYKWKEIPSELADKYAVRNFVSRTIGSEYLNEIYGVYKNADDIDFSKFPESFAIKATHGSNLNIIIKNRYDFDEYVIREKCRTMLSDRFGLLSNEQWYLGIQPQLIVEKLIYQKGFELPLDYKFFMFAGEPRFIQVNIRESQALTLSFYDSDWNRQAWGIKSYPQGCDIEQPKQLERMFEISRKLAQGFDFVRVDLYAPNDKKILFGELTFAPNSGIKRFIPSHDTDYLLGKLWHIL